MGFYYSIYFKNKKGQDCEIQFKNAGDNDPFSFEIGDSITTPDGIHFDHDACFVVLNGKIIAAFEKDDNVLFTKWGNMIPFPELGEVNPLQKAIKKMIELQNAQECDATDDAQGGDAGKTKNLKIKEL